ncbi:hypothetical protein KP806_20345 [Paenibacillus sp. N4]|uniref:hypothetical protein n=1 Tax=Paenibacillus vietnamensis TaxID=2590547 RepID=UPI001CD1663D|nr:hypothetical protein [Paenibacillus vietnamensis]MCA0757413.1 hypothetical protein [Paenibacillus vietnamensis]
MNSGKCGPEAYRCNRLLFAADGAVTTFSVIVLSSLLLFFSLLIDYARIAAFHKLSEDAARTGVRSVLSAYDSFLYERYGLFGRGGTDGQELFSGVLEENAKGNAASEDGAFQLVRMRLEAAGLHDSEYLGKHEIFTRQVQEEMKYKAPVGFTLDLASKFAPIAGVMKEAAASVGLLESMRKLYEQREAHIARVLVLQQQAASAVSGSGIDAVIPVRAAELAAGGGNNALAVAAEYGRYAAQMLQDQSAAAEGDKLYSAETQAYEQKARDVGMELRRLSSEMQRLHDRLMLEAVKDLEAARLLNEQMQGLARQADHAASARGFDRVKEGGAQGAAGSRVPADAENELAEVRQEADKLLLQDSWFSSYKQELDEQGKAASAIHMETGAFQSNSLAAIAGPFGETANNNLAEGVSSLRLAYGGYEEKYIRPALVLAARRQSLESGNVKAKLKEQEQQAGALWDQARSLLHGLTALPQTEEHDELFEQVRQRYEANLLFNRHTEAAAASAGYMQAGNAYAAADQAASLSGSLFTGMAGVLERTLDSLYESEYAAGRFSAFAPQHLKGLLTGGDLTELAHAAAFNNQEAEYVLYGFHNPTGNLAAAYGQLFAARLAVRTMEGLIDNRALGHPLLILSAALVYGLEKTMEDMLAFSERGTAPLSRFLATELSYEDYLRLFLLISDASSAGRTARMIAVIEQNSGTVLSAVPTGVSGEARLSMELWFIPGLMRVLGRFGLLDGRVVGNRYETTHTIGWSY